MRNNIQISIPNISGNERNYLNKCIDEGYVSSVGRFVNDFEEGLVDKTGIKYCNVVSSGTNALLASLITSGVDRDGLVIIPDYTFIATANAVHFAGASPWIFDIDPKTLNLNIEFVSDVIRKTCKYINSNWVHKSTNKKISAIIPVFAMGNYISFEKLNSFYNEFGIPIIIDAAGALSTKDIYKEFEILDYASVIFSFNGNKIITTGGGGAILTNNKKLALLQKEITSTARIANTYSHKSHAFNFRMTNLQAAVRIAQLERLEEFLDIKARIYNSYANQLGNIPAIHFQNVKSNHWLSYFIFDEKISSGRVQKFYSQLNDAGIMLREFWIPISEQKPYSKNMKNLNGTTSSIYKKVVTLPSSTGLSREDISLVCKEIMLFFE